jgi:hypothetical protein
MHATEPIDFATLHDLAVIACDADPEARPVAMDPNDARDQAMRVAAILAQLGLPSRVDLSPTASVSASPWRDCPMTPAST